MQRSGRRGEEEEKAVKRGIVGWGWWGGLGGGGEGQAILKQIEGERRKKMPPCRNFTKTVND